TDRFFDIRIEGASLARTEREEIGALLDQRRGDIDQLIAHLQTL
ncbi:MAG: phospholipid transport system substrate-binding protein, partial [Dinoroseobacter sp.]